MNRVEQYQYHRSYIEQNGLHTLINFQENIDYQEDIFDSVSGDLTIAVPPEADDLVRLHKLVRSRKSFTVLEFGLGYSTLIIADALEKNEADWNALREKPKIRNRHMFQLFSLDASEGWIKHTQKSIPVDLQKRIHIKYSPVEIGTFQGKLCHYYKELHDIVPDFIYLDGPDPKDVKGKINGLSFACDERTVMAADLLLMEPTFLPGTFILVDGRTNNARFLEKNFSREYSVEWSKTTDTTTFELIEPRLGKYNLLGTDFL